MVFVSVCCVFLSTQPLSPCSSVTTPTPTCRQRKLTRGIPSQLASPQSQAGQCDTLTQLRLPRLFWHWYRHSSAATRSMATAAADQTIVGADDRSSLSSRGRRSRCGWSRPRFRSSGQVASSASVSTAACEATQLARPARAHAGRAGKFRGRLH